MQIKTDAIKVLIKEKFRNNQRWFSEEIGINHSYLSCILNNKVEPNSKKAIDGIISYCKRNNLNFEDYISLP